MYQQENDDRQKAKRSWVTPEAKVVVGSPDDIQMDPMFNPGMDGVTFEGS